MKLQLRGVTTQGPAIITVMIDGIEMFSGSVDQHLEEITYCEYEHGAQTGAEKIIGVTVSVLNGTVGIGSALIWVDDFAPRVPGFYTPRDNRKHIPCYEIDHRTNIVINGQAPLPSKENPTWNGWVFTLTNQDVMTFDVALPHWPKKAQELPFCLGDADNGNLQWYDAQGNKIDSDPLGEEFWLARQNGVDR
jgi:hypothetical protein